MKSDVTEFSNWFRKNPSRGVLVGKRLTHWQEMLEEWCLVHERYCRLANDQDAIYWCLEGSNRAALAGAAWRAGWAALEEFAQDKKIMQSRVKGRGDLYLKTPVSEDYLECKVHWCHEGQNRSTGTLKWIETACSDARALHLPKGKSTNRIGVVFAVPSFLQSETHQHNDVLASLVETLQRASLDAAAWCFPSTRHPLISETDDRVYPGILLLFSAPLPLARAWTAT